MKRRSGTSQRRSSSTATGSSSTPRRATREEPQPTSSGFNSHLPPEEFRQLCAGAWSLELRQKRCCTRGCAPTLASTPSSSRASARYSRQRKKRLCQWFFGRPGEGVQAVGGVCGQPLEKRLECSLRGWWLAPCST